MDALIHILRALRAMPFKRFWLIWFTTTTAAVIYVMSVVGQAASRENHNAGHRHNRLIRTWRQLGKPGAFVTPMLITFLAFYIAIILLWENFAYYDNDLLMLYALKGRNFPLSIWPDTGRFFPFSMQEFNLIRHFTNTPTGYHLVPIVQLLIVFCILLILDTELSIAARVALAILVLLTPSMFLTFGGLIYEERNVIFLLACLVLSVKQFDKSRAVAWAVTAVVCAQIMLYYKEVAFLLLLGLAGGRLMLRCRDIQRAQWDYARLRDPESRLDLCLAALAVLFLFSYFAVMGIHGNMNYVTRFGHSMVKVVLGYLRLDLLVWLFLAVLLRRVYLILRNRTAPWPLWDGLAFGGVAYFLAYIYLSLFNVYYLAPVDLVAVLYVGRFVLLSWKHTPSWTKLAIVMLGCAVVLQDVSFSTFAAFERKNNIHAKVEIASVVAARYRSAKGSVPTLFFPFAKPYPIMEFVIYLNYRNVPINSVMLAKGSVARDDRCVEYRSVRCHLASEPAQGDLVVVLPDDEASLADALKYRRHGQLLFSYQPRPAIPRWLYAFVGSVGLPSHIYNQTRPDRWMDASVTFWE
jgi:hypothetical protein